LTCTVKNITNIKDYISGTIRDSQQISTDLSSLGSWLGPKEIWSNLNNKVKTSTVEKYPKWFNANIFGNIHKKVDFHFDQFQHSLQVLTKLVQGNG
jgi:hypothetical protein